MDIICPLPKTERSNLYILTVFDHFTKHVKANDLPDQEAVNVARVFLNEFVARGDRKIGGASSGGEATRAKQNLTAISKP